MDLGVSALTRRDRLERIASAERDRRTGRVDLAVAVLGEGREWPARVILALARLPQHEGAQTRAILEQSLDDWAAETGLEPLSPCEAASRALLGAEVCELSEPIDHDELELAFAAARVQTDEMLDVNEVAQRVLQDEPLGLDEYAADELDAFDLGLDGDDASADDGFESAAQDDVADARPEPDARETDAAWAEPAIWPVAVGPRGFDAAAVSAERRSPTRSAILATLERWLGNLEKSRAGRAR